MRRSCHTPRAGTSADGGCEPLPRTASHGVSFTLGFPCPFDDAPPPPLSGVSDEPRLTVVALQLRTVETVVVDASPSPTTSEESRTVANCSITSRCSSSGSSGSGTSETSHAPSDLRSIRSPDEYGDKQGTVRSTLGLAGYRSDATTASDQALGCSSPAKPNSSSFGSSDMRCATATANVYAAQLRTASRRSVRTTVGEALVRRRSPLLVHSKTAVLSPTAVITRPPASTRAEAPSTRPMSATVGLPVAPATAVSSDFTRSHNELNRFGTPAAVSVKVGLRPDPCQEHPSVPIARSTGSERSYTKLFVGQIPTFVDAKPWLAELFAPFSVRDILVRGHSQRATAFVWCGSRDRAEAAVAALNGFQYENNGTWYALCVEPSLSSYK